MHPRYAPEIIDVDDLSSDEEDGDMVVCTGFKINRRQERFAGRFSSSIIQPPVGTTSRSTALISQEPVASSSRLPASPRLNLQTK